MRWQTDREFGQNKNKDRIKRITIISFVLKFAVVRLLQQSKRLESLKNCFLRLDHWTEDSEKIRPNRLVEKTTNNLSIAKTEKYDFAPEKLEVTSKANDIANNIERNTKI